ncbi:MAG: tRNA threonylcarbamoyladenosine dehydratase [Eubacteriales bacterium]|nr:tRNA threonylcarbamoyladenosine dehydratase [Eubacteriales bacterium]
MNEQFTRSRMLLGEEAMNRLEASRVAVFGVGGVGGFVVEALARSGIGTIDIIDNDTVALSNLNRQIIATMDTVGRDKVDVMKERIQSINPDAVVNARKCFFLPETAEQFDFTAYDYVVDAIDTVTGKIQLIVQAGEAGVPIISAMGAGNKMDPTKFEVADIYSTSIDPLARVMRRELKKRGVKSLKVVYSKEKPMVPRAEAEENACPEPAQETEEHKRRSTPGSLAFVPSVAGLIIAGEVIKDLAGL